MMTTNNVRLEVCHGGCGGIWFDKFELDNLDEKTKVDKWFLDSIESRKSVTVNPEKKIQLATSAATVSFLFIDHLSHSSV